MSEKESKDDKPKEFEQQVLQRVEAKYHDELQNLMETCFNKLDMKEKGKEKKKIILSQSKPSNNGWPQILQFQLNFNFFPPKTLTENQLKEQLNLLFKCLCEVKKKEENCLKEEKSVKDGHLIPKLDGIQITCLSQLVVQYIWEIYRREGHQLEILLSIIAFLEWAKDFHSDCTASIQIMLCRLYGIFGCVERIKEMEKQIQLKFIQKDSLAFLRFFTPYHFGRFKEANIYYTDLGVMFDMNERETNECLVNAYKNNSFAQIQNLIEFSEKANNSIFSIGGDILNRILTVCFTPLEEKSGGGEKLASILIGDEKSHPIDWDKLSDNRDFSVFPTIISDKLIKQLAEYSFTQMKNYFYLKNAIITAIGNIGNILLEDKIAKLELAMVECNSFLNDREKDFENEEIFENYINIKLLNKLIKTTKLFNLPQLLLNISLDIQKQFNNKREEKNLILKLNLNEEKEGINFTNCLNFLEKFWKNEEEKGEENNNWKNKIEIIQNLAIVIEILGLSLVACKLLENTCNSEHLQSIDNPLITSSSSDSIKRSEKTINNSSFLNSLRARAIQPIGGSLKRIRLFLTKNFVVDFNKQQIENNLKLNEIMEIIPEVF
uniref:Uncharacterized protein n=1 Tax=Meloidogyne incognita TaxID=6306 RepID=A0A914LCZ7_MELIC